MGDIGVYGGMLDAFPELFQQMHFWVASNKVGGGYIPGKESFVSGILLDVNSNELLRRRIGAGYALDSENQDLLWVSADAPVEAGMFFHHPQDGSVFRIVSSLDKNLPGGFKRFLVERAGGANGLNEEEVPISEGAYM